MMPTNSWDYKLQQAKRYILAFEDEVRDYRLHNPYRVERKIDSVGHLRRLQLIAKIGKPLPGWWGAVAGDILFDTRSALDHLVYDLTCVYSGKPLEETAFPIFDTRPQFFHVDPKTNLPARDSGLHMIRGIDPKAKTLIKWLQPYRRGDPLGHPLRRLNKLHNIDKHQRLHLAFSTIRDPVYRFMPEGLVRRTTTHTGRFEDGTVLASAVYNLPIADDEMQVDATLPFEIALDEAYPGMGEPVLSLLRDLLTYVRWSVCDPIADRFLHW